jgi:hypothetical protein
MLLAACAGTALLASLSGGANAGDEKQQCLAASDEGQQLRDDGGYRRARDAFASCARDVCPGLVRDDCMKWLAELDQSIPSVVVGAKDPAGSDLVDVAVLVDGALLAPKLDGKPIQVDPGAHLLRFETAGYPAVELHVVVRAGEKSRLLAVQFGTPTPLLSPMTPTASPVPSLSAGDDAPRPHGPRTSAWIFGGIAAAAFGTEAYFGLRGLSDRSALQSQTCAQTATCAQTSVDAIRTKFTVADVALAIGIANAAIAVYLFVATPSAPGPTRAAGIDLVPVPGGAAMSMAGRF